MGLIDLRYRMQSVEGKFKHLSLSRSEFQRFNTSILGLGDISKEGKHFDALAAMFDLEGFTAFCNQIDPQLVVPEYLDQMLAWLFHRISYNFVKETHGEIVLLWGKFPFFAKFMGDGVMFLWDTQGLGQASMGNIIINLHKICAAYKSEFLPKIEKSVSKVPIKLRCGIARGEVIAVGGGKDFVGSCINIASRLQNISELSFAFARKGFNPQECFSETWQAEFVAKRVSIRGLDQEELIFVFRKEYDALPEEKKRFFKEP
jgi:class 3 adenylate cyclase